MIVEPELNHDASTVVNFHLTNATTNFSVVELVGGVINSTNNNNSSNKFPFSNTASESVEYNILCKLITANHHSKEETIICNGTTYVLPERIIDSSHAEFWVYLSIYIVLVLFAGLMSGLTLAILSLDLTSLKVLLAAGSKENAKYARRLIPLVKRRHMVLVTLVLANAFSVEAMPIFMDRISDPITAVLVSCTAVLIFGEVLPQAVSSRFGLKIGYCLAWLVWCLMCLLFLVALPFSYLLDTLLGKESGTFYGRKELQALVDIHGPTAVTLSRQNSQHKQRNPFSCTTCSVSGNFCNERLTEDEVMIIKGALNMSSKTASTAMVKLDDVFMLSSDTVFDQNCLRTIFDIGHSRIPVYSGDKTNVVGVFLTKRLITIDPNQGATLRQLIEDTSISRAFYPGLKVDQYMPLYELLNRFQTGTMSHIAFVTRRKEDKKPEEIIGIVTLEDVIEELLQEEIFDESDVKRNLCVVSLALPKIYRQLKDSSQKIVSETKLAIAGAASAAIISSSKAATPSSNGHVTYYANHQQHHHKRSSSYPENNVEKILAAADGNNDLLCDHNSASSGEIVELGIGLAATTAEKFSSDAAAADKNKMNGDVFNDIIEHVTTDQYVRPLTRSSLKITRSITSTKSAGAEPHHKKQQRSKIDDVESNSTQNITVNQIDEPSSPPLGNQQLQNRTVKFDGGGSFSSENSAFVID